MDWILFAFLAPIVYTAVIFIDKYIVSREIKNSSGMPVFTAITGLLSGIVCFIFFGHPLLSLYDAFVAITSGILTVWGLYFYFRALAQDEASTVIVFFQLVPVFILIMTYVFLGETITWKQIVGFTIIFASTFAVSLEKKKNNFQLPKTFGLILLADLFWSTASVLIKYAVNANSLIKIISYENFGVAIGGMLLYCFFPSIRKAFYENILLLKKRTLGVLFINEALFLLSKSLTYYAYSLGPAALVSVIASTQVFLGVILGWVLTLTMREVFKEQIERRNLIKKLVAGLVILIGIVLIA